MWARPKRSSEAVEVTPLRATLSGYAQAQYPKPTSVPSTPLPILAQQVKHGVVDQHKGHLGSWLGCKHERDASAHSSPAE
jgi:hypothetical protein